MSIRLIKDCNEGRRGDVFIARNLSYENGKIYYKDATGTWKVIPVDFVEVL